uniref:Uncharacterized protein n=1 Tax=Setaria italica TaxID=4555 RepID=K3ZPQ3_SETIT
MRDPPCLPSEKPCQLQGGVKPDVLAHLRQPQGVRGNAYQVACEANLTGTAEI